MYINIITILYFVHFIMHVYDFIYIKIFQFNS